ncbi:unnamed protein product [Acanthosepion pharaonis]|uniref:Uncharacterized protein n=1 Tax=Acanthosepion pharaonis TaxID=158019 RepID=A0A812CY77_ACAPH|nr:unnamed protein product [Sepia pharaonis]
MKDNLRMCKKERFPGAKNKLEESISFSVGPLTGEHVPTVREGNSPTRGRWNPKERNKISVLNCPSSVSVSFFSLSIYFSYEDNSTSFGCLVFYFNFSSFFALFFTFPFFFFLSFLILLFFYLFLTSFLLPFYFFILPLFFFLFFVFLSFTFRLTFSLLFLFIIPLSFILFSFLFFLSIFLFLSFT